MTVDYIKSQALKYFDLVGVARAETPASLPHYEKWLEEGAHGDMHYLARHTPKKKTPQLVLPDARSWIALAVKYGNADEPLSVDVAKELQKEGLGWIARYARGEDYHAVLERRLQEFCGELSKKFPEESFWFAVDSKPVLERDVAQRAGLGWIGKNTCLINKDSGSFLFLAEVLTTLDLEPDKPVLDHCGTCDRCLKACPTGALTEKHLDSRLCISYWTIESKKPAPPELGSKFGQNVFGCDICQDVCPWNKHALRREFYRNNETVDAASTDARFNPNNTSQEEVHPLFSRLDLRDFLKKSPQTIEKIIENTALERAGVEKLLENAALALKNSMLSLKNEVGSD